MRQLIALCLLAASLPAVATVVGQDIEYSADGTVLRGYLAYDDALPGQRPGVIVVHEWWGHNAYARQRANMLAGEGYVALALDMYGAGRNTQHPEQAKAFMQAVTQQSGAVRQRFAAAREQLARHPASDPARLAAIGYCFGGGVVLNMARAGVDLAGVVSFHGSLGTENPAGPGEIVTPILVLNGEADPFVPAEQVAAFKQEMDRAGANYTYVGYPGVKHAFTNPGADRAGAQFGLPLAYDAQADQDAWLRMLNFFDRIFWRPGT